MTTVPELKDDGWFQRKRERSTLPKLHLMLGRMWALGEMIHLGDRRAWVLGRYETYRHSIELNVPDRIHSFPHSSPSSPVGEEVGKE